MLNLQPFERNPAESSVFVLQQKFQNTEKIFVFNFGYFTEVSKSKECGHLVGTRTRERVPGPAASLAFREVRRGAC